eukprot:15462491-Alexandrium_andersonii.AAC.1
MEALFASCNEEFQHLRNSREQEVATIEGLKAEIISISGLLNTIDTNINALETEPTGAQSVLTGGTPSPVGSPPVSMGEAASGVGWNRTWALEEWADWRQGTRNSAQQTPAPAGYQS